MTFYIVFSSANAVVTMTDLSLKSVPARNLLTGAVVTLPEDDSQLMGDAPGNLTLAWKDLSVYRRKRNQSSIWRSATYEEIKVIHEGMRSFFFIVIASCT